MKRRRKSPVLRAIAELGGEDVEALRAALLAHGSETPDNRAAVAALRRYRGSWRVGKVSLASVIYEIEACDQKALLQLMERSPRRQRPSREELGAALRLVVLILTAANAAGAERE